MSEPPLASLPLTGKTKKASRTGGTNVSKKLLMEFHALIAFACYDSPSIAGGGVAMTEPVMEKLMMKLCFGDNDDQSIVCYADQFLLGLNKFKALYASGPGGGSPSAVDLSASLDATLIVPPNLHRQGISTFLLEMLQLRRGCCTRSHSPMKPQQGGQCFDSQRKC